MKMADIELVIKIPEEIYKASQIIDVKYEDVIQIPLEVIKNGISLPKGHGRLIDADTIYLIDEDFLCQSDYVVAEGAVDNAPTIIEADKVESEDKRR